MDHYILHADINLQTNVLKQNLKFILNLEQVWEYFRIWIFGMLHMTKDFAMAVALPPYEDIVAS